MNTATAGVIASRRKGRPVRVIRQVAGFAASASSLLVLLALWWVAGRFALVDPFLLPPLEEVVVRVWGMIWPAGAS